jgi:meiotically up-regulated gene 157 (Mug157) protein
MSTIERSRNALEKLKQLLNSVMSPNDQPWIWTPTSEYPSVPYQPTSLLNQHIPKSIHNREIVPQSVRNEINRVCQQLKKANQIGGEIWCKLFTKCYADTLATTTTLLDDNSTYIITGDIDLMWLRDSSAQVHQYMTLSNDIEIQRIIEGLIRRQTQFIFSDPYGSSFRLTLRPNPPSDDSLQSHHTKKGRNVHVAMHNYELDSLCYHLRLSYTWWKQTKRVNAFNQQWLTAVSIIIQVMIIEQHHTEISPYRYTELTNNYQGTRVSYTGMTWSAFRPSDDQTQFGYLIPSNMMAAVVLEQLTEMIKNIFPEQTQLIKQVKIINK